MPTYQFKCGCGAVKAVLFRTLPPEAKQRSSVCEECGGAMERDFANEGFYAVGGTNFEVAAAAAFGAGHVDPTSGIPRFKDENGRVNEIRSSRDLDKWRTSNQLGKPRMVEWTNPVTGKTYHVPQRTIMKADPETGEPVDAGAVIRTSERLVPLDGPDEFTPPSESRTGRPIVNGVLKNQDPSEVKLGMVDPATGKPMTLGSLWGDDKGFGEGGAKARRALKGGA